MTIFSTKIFSVGADKKGMLWDLGSNGFQQVAAHDQPITCCAYAKTNQYECVVTGSLDKTIKLWDMRQQNPVITFNCPEVRFLSVIFCQNKAKKFLIFF